MNLASPSSTRYPPLSILRGSPGGPSQRPGFQHADSDDRIEEQLEMKVRRSVSNHNRPPDRPRMSDPNDDDESQLPTPSKDASIEASDSGSPPSRFSTIKAFAKRQLKYVGPGVAMSVAYCDPGNWQTDLSAGSQYGYTLLFVILMAGCFGIVLQILALRMGIVCQKDLAVLTREWALQIGSRSRYADANWLKRSRVGLLWLLYFVAEGAVICTELAELVGSAIALTLLFPALPIWAGVLITSADVFLILFIYRPNTRSLRWFEFFVGLLVLMVIGPLIAIVVTVDPVWGDVFEGYLPSREIINPGPLYVSIGILGATVMPHGLFLGSHFAMFDRDNPDEPSGSVTPSQESVDDEEQQQPGKDRAVVSTANRDARVLKRWLHSLRLGLVRLVPGIDPASIGLDTATKEEIVGTVTAPILRPLDISSLRGRMMHATIDVAASMLMFALTTNSFLLIVAAQAFYYGVGNRTGIVPEAGSREIGDLFQAFELLRDELNHASAILFAIALLAAGQSASITVTLAGQIISEGMINWKTNPFLRRCLTRAITLVPSLAVSIAVGRDGLDTMLVASQVALFHALPFVLFPLLCMTGSRAWMTVKGLPNSNEATQQVGEEAREVDTPLSAAEAEDKGVMSSIQHFFREGRLARWIAFEARGWGQVKPVKDSDTESLSSSSLMQVTFASSWVMVAVTSGIFAVIVLSDGYVIITTAMGTA